MKKFSFIKSMRWIFVVFTLAIIATAILPIALSITRTTNASQVPQTTLATGHFQVQGNTVFDPDGNRFIAKGMNAFLGRFASGWYDGPDHWGAVSYQNRIAQIDAMQKVGINFVRILIDPRLAPGGSKALDGTVDEFGNTYTYWGNLDELVQDITTRGMVVDISTVIHPTDTSGPTPFTRDQQGIDQEKAWLTQLANRYKNNSYVWINPENEPNCFEALCDNWGYWHYQQQQFIDTIRATGFQAPLVINTPIWSSTLASDNCILWNNPKDTNSPTYTSSCDIDTPSLVLHDTNSNLMYGLHKYSVHDNYTWDDQVNIPIHEAQYGRFVSNHAIFLEEAANHIFNGQPESPTWEKGYLAYWITKINQGAVGVSAFTWLWANDITIKDRNSNGSEFTTFTRWGQSYKENYLDKLTTPVASPTPTTQPTPTVTPTITPTATPTPINTPTPTIIHPTPSPLIPVNPVTIQANQMGGAIIMTHDIDGFWYLHQNAVTNEYELITWQNEQTQPVSAVFTNLAPGKTYTVKLNGRYQFNDGGSILYQWDGKSQTRLQLINGNTDYQLGTITPTSSTATIQFSSDTQGGNGDRVVNAITLSPQ